MQKGYILVEGHGEVEAAGNLVNRLWQEAGHCTIWQPPIRCKNIHQRKGIEQGVGRIRMEKDVGALLVLQDLDDGCPKDIAPEIARWIAKLEAPFPVAIVLLHREYEVLFLPCLEKMAGKPIKGTDGQERPGIVPGTRYNDDWEKLRGIKEWLSDHFPPRQSYKPTFDQLPLTRMIDFKTLRDANVPCFGTLERALDFLASNWGRGGVYPRVSSDPPDGQLHGGKAKRLPA